MQQYSFIEALMRRIRDDDDAFLLIQEQFYRLQAGLAGETKLLDTLADYDFKHDYTILSNFECFNERGFPHQIDTLLLTAHFVLVIEVKQLSGVLFYDHAKHEFSRQLENGSVENFKSPFDQVYRHKRFVEQLLEKAGIMLPVEQLVVSTNYRARFDRSLQAMPIIHVSGLPFYLDKLFSTYPASRYSPHHLRTLFEQIAQPLPLRQTIEPARLKTGVFCVRCDAKTPMSFHYGVWRCPHCRFESKDIVWNALSDYRILIEPRITNEAFRHFTGISSRKAATRMLSYLKLPAEGKNRGRVYLIPENIERVQ